jgi:ABC-type sugar transport system ATPase subunit
VTSPTLHETRTLRIEALDKSYGPTHALKGLSLAVASNRIVGIVGPNGAGKSTLVKILAGEEREDGGTLSVDSTVWSAERRRRSVAIVHQEPQLFPNLTVAENLLVENAGLRRPRPTREVRALLERLEIAPMADVLLENTSIVVWQLTEIARALLRSAEVFLFDEPNSALTREESRRLFEQMELLKSPDRFVFLVSHRLGEVAEVCQEVAVVRDGAVVTTLAGDEVTSDRLASLLAAEELGASAAPAAVPASAPAPPAAASARPLPAPGARLEGIPGLVIAVTGPEGGGGREIVRAASVRAPAPDGRRRATERAYMPSDRQHSLFFNLSVAANIAARLRRDQLPGRPRLLTQRAFARAAQAYIEEFDIKTERPGASVGSLSGGNQQKVALASALAVDPALLVVEEPTRGVDVSTKRQIYAILRNFAAAGGAVVLYVTELEDALGCADQLYVVSEHAIRGMIDVKAVGELEELGVAVNRLLSRRRDDAA